MAPRFKPPTVAGLLLVGALLCANCGLFVANAADVEVIVNPTLYASGQIAAGLNQYLADLADQGYTTTLTSTMFADAAALRSHLAQGYTDSGLEGVVLIGNLPVPYFERNGQFGQPTNYQRFACDLYYTDVNGLWTDVIASSNPGTLDTHTGNVAPELWLGRLTAAPLVGLHPGRSESQLLNDYFAKNHAYRLGFTRMRPDGLAYIDDDWAALANMWAGDLAVSVAGAVDVIKDGPTTTAGDYLARLSPDQGPGYESVLLAAHANSQCHGFKAYGQLLPERVYNSQLADANPQAFFYNLFCCTNAAYDQTGYIGGEYLFGTDSALVVTTSTKLGAMLDDDEYYDPIAAGGSFGEALRDWYVARLGTAPDPTTIDWSYGMTLLGDPALLSQRFVPAVGDLNGDGVVGIGDLDVLRSHWGEMVTPGDALSGDLAGDGFVGASDLDVIRAHWGFSILSPLTVPEPSTTLLVATGALAMLLRRRRLRHVGHGQ